jgi:hypothetical protein
MTRVRFILALSLPVLAAGLLATTGISKSATQAVIEERAKPSCLGARATIVGTARADVLRGTRKRDVIVALGGSDRIHAVGGDDVLCGGGGDDYLDGGPGRNRLDGGPGIDTYRRAARSARCEKPARPLPAIAGLTLEGKRLSLTDFRGRAVFVNVWSSW